MKGNLEAAVPLFAEVHRLTNHPLKGLMGLGFAYARLGLTQQAMEIISKMEQRQAEEPGSVIDVELVAAWYGIGNLDKPSIISINAWKKEWGVSTISLNSLLSME
jgi:adenylate cyclase